MHSMTGIKLHVWGDYACFTRPEMKFERVSYEVMTPAAARGILDAMHWKPAIAWVVDRIHVLRPIRFQTFRRNEVASKIPAQKARAAMSRESLEGLGLAWPQLMPVLMTAPKVRMSKKLAHIQSRSFMASGSLCGESDLAVSTFLSSGRMAL